MNVCAIDPGKLGAYAVKVPLGVYVGKLYQNEKDDDPKDVVQDLLHAKVQRVLIEQVGASRFAHISSGIRYGRLKQSLLENGIGVVEVSASTWKRNMKLIGKASGLDSKASGLQAVTLAKELYPGVSLRRTEACKTDSVDFAEALLLLEYGQKSGDLR